MKTQKIDKDLLLDLGLTKNEVEVYLKLLMSGSVTVNIISERTGMHRQACYDALDRLLEKGFVNYVFKHNKKHFQALSPEKILVYIEEMGNRMKGMLPELEKLSKMSAEKSHVETYKGKNAMRIIHRDVLKSLKNKTAKEVLINGVDETKFLQHDSGAIESYIRNMKKFGFKERLLTSENAKFYFPGEQSEYRSLPEKFFNPNPTYIYEDKVVFFIWGEPMYAIMIQNANVADANKKQFEMLWKIAKPVNKE